MARRSALRDKFKGGMSNRHQEQYDRKDESGRFKNFLVDRLPVPQWKPKEGEHLLEIIPYLVGKQSPDPGLQEGDPNYVLDVFVHRNIGINSDTVVCPAKYFRGDPRPCPICKEASRLGQILNEDDFKKALDAGLRVSRRALYNVWIKDSSSTERQGVQIWDASHFLFSQHIDSRSKLPRGGGTIEYSDPDNGKSIYFRQVGTRRDTKYMDLDFLERDEPIPDEILEQAVSLDELVQVMDYDDLHKKFFDAFMVGDDQPTTRQPARPTSLRDGRRSFKDDEPPGDDQLPDSWGGGDDAPFEDVSELCPIGAIFGEDFDTYQDCSQCDVYDACQEANNSMSTEPEPEPTAPPTRPTRRQSAAMECPYGGEFGHDHAQLEDVCGDCDVFEACEAEYNKLMAPVENAKPATPPKRPPRRQPEPDGPKRPLKRTAPARRGQGRGK